MKNKHSVLRANAPTPRTASAGRATEEGSGTVLALTIIAGVLILTYSRSERRVPTPPTGAPPPQLT